MLHDYMVSLHVVLTEVLVVTKTRNDRNYVPQWQTTCMNNRKV